MEEDAQLSEMAHAVNIAKTIPLATGEILQALAVGYQLAIPSGPCPTQS